LANAGMPITEPNAWPLSIISRSLFCSP
jgi:hypothetical protein